jgi:hypothetical protein
MVAEHVVASVIRQVRSFGSEVEFKFEFERLIDGVLYSATVCALGCLSDARWTVL